MNVRRLHEQKYAAGSNTKHDVAAGVFKQGASHPAIKLIDAKVMALHKALAAGQKEVKMGQHAGAAGTVEADVLGKHVMPALQELAEVSSNVLTNMRARVFGMK